MVLEEHRENNIENIVNNNKHIKILGPSPTTVIPVTLGQWKNLTKKRVAW